MFVCVWGVTEEFKKDYVCVCVCDTCSRLASISGWILCQAHSVWHAADSLLPHVPEMDEHWCECTMAPLGAILPLKLSPPHSLFFLSLPPLEYNSHILLCDYGISFSLFELYIFIISFFILSSLNFCISIMNVTVMWACLWLGTNERPGRIDLALITDSETPVSIWCSRSWERGNQCYRATGPSPSYIDHTTPSSSFLTGFGLR